MGHALTAHADEADHDAVVRTNDPAGIRRGHLGGLGCGSFAGGTAGEEASSGEGGSDADSFFQEIPARLRAGQRGLRILVHNGCGRERSERVAAVNVPFRKRRYPSK